ncbi:hypothetical protein SLEP1_g21170 [Rubroshorea leprosula]|uniref:Uncharacterized protein n=1 Tax=Rubroshorea leprosula TaxID=152421 RepID=A0AAV5J524_9ROSI|nr:hypothetical protein SLEP1_g21170 [Rubroshorea leprosula]
MHLKGQLAVKRGDGEPLEEFIRKFKRTCDNLAAIRKPLEDLDKVFQLSRVVGTRLQPYNLAVLSKAPYPTFTQYIASLQNNERDLQSAEQENKDKILVYAQAFVAHRGRGHQRGRGYGGGRNFNSRGRGFVQAGNYHNYWTSNNNNNKSPMVNNNPPPQQPMSHKSQEKNVRQQELPQALATLSLLEDKNQNIYVDSGASDHMISDSGPSNASDFGKRN